MRHKDAGRSQPFRSDNKAGRKRYDMCEQIAVVKTQRECITGTVGKSAQADSFWINTTVVKYICKSFIKEGDVFSKIGEHGIPRAGTRIRYYNDDTHFFSK